MQSFSFMRAMEPPAASQESSGAWRGDLNGTHEAVSVCGQGQAKNSGELAIGGEGRRVPNSGESWSRKLECRNGEGETTEMRPAGAGVKANAGETMRGTIDMFVSKAASPSQMRCEYDAGVRHAGEMGPPGRSHERSP